MMMMMKEKRQLFHGKDEEKEKNTCPHSSYRSLSLSLARFLERQARVEREQSRQALCVESWDNSKVELCV